MYIYIHIHHDCMGLVVTWQNEYYQTAIWMMTHVFLENEALFPFVSFNSSDTPEACFETEPRTALKGCLFLVFPIFYSCEGQNWKTTGKTKEGQRKSQGSKVPCFLLVNFVLFDAWTQPSGCIDLGYLFEDFHWLHVFVVDFISSQKVSMGWDVVARLAINSPVMAAV